MFDNTNTRTSPRRLWLALQHYKELQIHLPPSSLLSFSVINLSCTISFCKMPNNDPILCGLCATFAFCVCAAGTAVTCLQQRSSGGRSMATTAPRSANHPPSANRSSVNSQAYQPHSRPSAAPAEIPLQDLNRLGRPLVPSDGAVTSHNAARRSRSRSRDPTRLARSASVGTTETYASTRPLVQQPEQAYPARRHS